MLRTKRIISSLIKIEHLRRGAPVSAQRCDFRDMSMHATLPPVNTKFLAAVLKKMILLTQRAGTDARVTSTLVPISPLSPCASTVEEFLTHSVLTITVL